MLTIAVTGANGYIGRHVVSSLCDMGARVYALDFNSEGETGARSGFVPMFSIPRLILKSCLRRSPMFACIWLGEMVSTIMLLRIWVICPIIMRFFAR